MIAVYSDNPDLLARVQERMDQQGVAVCQDLRDLAFRLQGAHARLIVLDHFSESDVDQLASIPFGTARSWIAVVTSLTSDAVKGTARLCGVGVEYISGEELEDRLPLWLETANRADILAATADSLSTRGTNPLIDRAIELACRCPSPPTTVRSLSALLHVDPSTLRYHWCTTLPDSGSPKQLLDWALFLRALEGRQGGKWTTVAYRLGVHKRTLERLSLRILGETLGTASREPGIAVRRFVEWSRSEFNVLSGATDLPG